MCNERRCDEFALVHSAPLKEDDCDQSAEQKERHDIRPKVEIVNRVSNDGIPRGRHFGAVVRVMWIYLAQSVIKEPLAFGRRLHRLSARFALSLAEGRAGDAAKHDRYKHPSDDICSSNPHSPPASPRNNPAVLLRRCFRFSASLKRRFTPTSGSKWLCIFG